MPNPKTVRMDDEFAEILEKIKSAVRDSVDASRNFERHDIPDILQGVVEDLGQELIDDVRGDQ